MWKRIIPELINSIVENKTPITRGDGDLDFYDFDSPTKATLIKDKTNLNEFRIIYNYLNSPFTDGIYTFDASSGVGITRSKLITEDRYFWDETSNDGKLRFLRKEVQKVLDSQFPEYEISRLTITDSDKIELGLSTFNGPKDNEVQALSGLKIMGIDHIYVGN